MALIKCPECGKEISDKAERCPNCGFPVKKINENKYIAEDKNENKNYSIIAAREEKKKIESRMTKGNSLAGKIAVVLGAMSLLFGFSGGGIGLILGGIFFLAIGIGTLGSLRKEKKRVQYLKNISDGRKEILICPYCKGTTIGFQTVQTGEVVSGKTARVSYNINPLHPLTHTNVKTSGTISSINYETLYTCQDCGKTFNNPDKIWQ